MLKKFIFALVLVSFVSSMELKDENIFKQISKKFQAAKETKECMVCLAVVNKARSYLDEGKTQEELFQDILKTCALFSATIDTQVRFFKIYFQELKTRSNKYMQIKSASLL